MMPSLDLDAASARLETYILSLQNDRVTPPGPLVRSVFDLVDDAMRNDNIAHPLPAVGIIHDDEALTINDVLGEGFSQRGTGTWVFVLMCDSPVRGQGMRGPRGAMTISGILKDALNDFPVDGEADEDNPNGGACRLSVIRRKRFAPDEADVKAVCGYSLVATHPIPD